MLKGLLGLSFLTGVHTEHGRKFCDIFYNCLINAIEIFNRILRMAMEIFDSYAMREARKTQQEDILQDPTWHMKTLAVFSHARLIPCASVSLSL